MNYQVYTFNERQLSRESNYIFQIVKDRRLSDIYHSHEFYEIICVLKGETQKLINEKQRKVEANSIVILRPGDRHCFLSQSADAAVLSLSVKPEEFVLISGAYDRFVVREMEQRADAAVISGEHFVRFLESLCSGNLSSPCREQDKKFLLMCFLKAYLESTNEISQIPQMLEYAIREMKKTENLKRGIEAFLELSHYSQSQLSRLIRSHFGQSLKQYLNELRLQSAYDDIVLTNRSLQEISEGIGFASFSHFNKIFKSKFSITPSALRRKNGIWTT